MNRTIVIYYSLEGNTMKLAERLAEELNCEKLRLKPCKEIKSKGFLKYVWGGKQAVMNESPQLEHYNFDANKYDNIIFAFPVWAGKAAPPIKSFIDKENIDGKKVAFFSTHEGGKGKAEQNFEGVLKAGNIIVDKVDFLSPKKNETECLDKISEWSKGLKVKF